MKIRGNTVGTPMRPEKFLVKARNLTEEEKAQARANIGAAAEGDSPGGSGISALIVTLSEDGKTASHTSAQIYDHIENGGIVYLFRSYVGEALYIPCTFSMPSSAYFSYMQEDDTGWVYFIGDAAQVDCSYHEYANNSDIPEALPNPHALTFTGAVSATYDGSKAVSIEIPSGGGSGGASGWTHIDTIDLSSGALSYEFDTTGYGEIMLVNTAALTMSGSKIFWKDVTRNVANQDTALQKNVGSIMNLNYLGNGYIVWLGARASDTLLNTHVIANAKESNNTLLLTFSSVTSGTIVIAGRA